jgi:hypothetical protein
MNKPKHRQHLITAIIAISVVALLVKFPISFGGEDKENGQQPQQAATLPEQSIRLDSLVSLMDILRNSKSCSVDLTRPRGRAILKVGDLNDKTDLLGKDWQRLIKEYKSSLCEIMVNGNDVTFQCKTEMFQEVEYVTLPLHVLHALAELKQ